MSLKLFKRNQIYLTCLCKHIKRYSLELSDFEIQYKSPRIIKATPIPMALYGGRHTVTMIPGAGIGPELANYVRQVFSYAGAPVDFEIIEMDNTSDDNTDLEYAVTSIRRNGVAIKGNIETKSVNSEVQLRNVTIRNMLDLYAYVICCKSYKSVPARHKDVDIVVIRQNTEGEYSMLEHLAAKGVVENLKIITKSNSLRLAKFSFEYATKNKRKKITTVHKANIMKLSDGLFLKTMAEVAKEYPQIEHNHIIIDNCCMQLVSKPQQFDIIVAPNLYGNIITNVVCGITGGPGLMSGKNYGDQYAVFEPGTRNNGTLIAGKNMANPVAMLNASVDMLNHLGHVKYAKKIDNAIERAISEYKIHTPDIGGTATSTEMVNKIIDLIQKDT